MALIKFDGEHTTMDTYAVAVYALEREYGGPEEGGWWYTTRELIAVATADTATGANELADRLENGEYKNTGRSLGSVNFGMSGQDAAYLLRVYDPGDKIPHDDSDSSHYE